MIEISNFMGNKDKKYYGVFFLFGFFLVLFVSVYCSIIQTTKYSFIFYFIKYSIFYGFIFFIPFIFYILNLLKIKIEKNLYIFFVGIFLILMLIFFNILDIKEKRIYQSINIEEMEKNLIIDKFTLQGNTYVLKGRTPTRYGIPQVIKIKNNEKLLFQCHLVNIKCPYISSGKNNHKIYMIEYYITSKNRNIIFRMWNQDGVIINFKDDYMNFIKISRLDVYLYTFFFLINFLYIVYIKHKILI